MTITSIQKLQSGKPGATITSNLDELAIIRGLVVNALRHMPDVCETTSTRQRLKAMSRALHKVYQKPKTQVNIENLIQEVRDLKSIQGQDGTWNCNPYMMGLYNGLELAIATLESREPIYRNKPETGWLNDRLPDWIKDAPVATLDAEQEGKLKAAIESVSKLKNPPAVFAEYTGKQWSLDKGVETACAAILSGMPPRFTYQEFADRVVKSGLTTDHEAREILASLLDISKEWMSDHVERVVKKVGVVHRRPITLILHGMPTPFARTQFIDEALDHGYTIDEISKWLNKWLDNNPWYKLDTKTDTVVSISDLKDCSPGIANAKTLDEVRGPNRAERDWMDRQCGAIDPKSIPNPDYVPVSTPAPEPTPKPTPTPTPKRTLWSIYNDMPNAFASTAFVKKSSNHGVETTKATDFLIALSRLDVIWRREDGLFVKTVTPNSRNITMLIGLIGQ